MKNKRRIFPALALALCGSACSIKGPLVSPQPPSAEAMAGLVKVDANPNCIMSQWSDAPGKTTFTIDGVTVGTQKSAESEPVSAAMDCNKSHRFGAEAEGYRTPATHFAQPPFDGIGHRVKWHFGYDDKLPAAEDATTEERPSSVRRGRTAAPGRHR